MVFPCVERCVSMVVLADVCGVTVCVERMPVFLEQ